MSLTFRVRKAERCKVCRSDLCDPISAMIVEGKPYGQIIVFAQAGGLYLNKNNLSRHKRHIISLVQEAEQEAVLERLVDVAKGNLVSDFDFLDLVRDQAVRFLRGEECLVPQGSGKGLFLISLGLRAVAIRRHVEGTSAFERELAELIQRAKRKALSEAG